jgi:hypothetical protein
MLLGRETLSTHRGINAINLRSCRFHIPDYCKAGYPRKAGRCNFAQHGKRALWSALATGKFNFTNHAREVETKPASAQNTPEMKKRTANGNLC